MTRIKRFIDDEAGADLIEYALLVGLVALAAVTALTNVGGSISGLFGKINTKLTTINP